MYKLPTLCQMYPITEFSLVHVFPYLDWIRRQSNTGKRRSEKFDFDYISCNAKCYSKIYSLSIKNMTCLMNVQHKNLKQCNLYQMQIKSIKFLYSFKNWIRIDKLNRFTTFWFNEIDHKDFKGCITKINDEWKLR